jgi:hypothetical protein
MNGNDVWTVSCGQGNITGLSTDPEGDVILLGYFFGSDKCSGASLTSAGGTDVMVTKLAAADGTVKWAKSFGDKANQVTRGVASDSNGNIYLVGGFEGFLTFGPGVTVLGNNDGYVAKLSASGEGIWAKMLGNSTGAAATGLAVDKLGASIVTGFYKGSISLNGAGSITNPSAADNHGFIAKLDSSGGGVWLVDSPEFIGGVAAMTSADDVMVATGEKSGKIGVSKLVGGTGAVVWSRVFGTDSASLAVGKLDEVFLSSSFKGALTFDSFTLDTNSSTNYDIFLAKLAP